MRKALVHFVLGVFAIVLSIGHSSAQPSTLTPEEAKNICSAIVDREMTAIVENSLHGCGFSNPDGRWTPDRYYQMNKCLVAINEPRIQDYWAFLTVANKMTSDVEVCKLTHVNKSCVSCHSSQSSKAVQAMPKSRNALRDPVRQLQERAKLKDAKVVDPCKPGTRSASSSPCNQPAAKATNSSAMDSLQGLSPSAAPSATREQRLSPSKSAPAAAPSAPAAPSPFSSKTLR